MEVITRLPEGDQGPGSSLWLWLTPHICVYRLWYSGVVHISCLLLLRPNKTVALMFVIAAAVKGGWEGGSSLKVFAPPPQPIIPAPSAKFSKAPHDSLRPFHLLFPCRTPSTLPPSYIFIIRKIWQMYHVKGIPLGKSCFSCCAAQRLFRERASGHTERCSRG